MGARTKARGFLPAKIIENGEFVEGVGGGVCQVSTTLYNCALLAGFNIEEYHPHSLAVSYVPPSRDAMVSGLSCDLKIKNNSDIIVTCTDNKNVIAALYVLAVKENNTNRIKDFCRLNYKLLESDWDTVAYGCGVDHVSEVFLSEQDRKTAQLIHDELMKRDYCYNFHDWNE